MTTARDILDAKMTEAQFQLAVTDLLTRTGWRWHHSRPAMTARGWRTAISGAAGAPDIMAVRGESKGPKGGWIAKRLVFIELKAQKGRLTADQAAWCALLSEAAECYVWRPSDWEAVENLLR